MSDHLLLITLGPVQDFIAAARRTRDLWFGSHLLSELSRAVAKCLADADATLIFPALERDHKELKPCCQPLRPPCDGGEMPLSIANKILAEVGDEPGPAKLAEQARAAAQARLKELAKQARHGAGCLVLQTDEAKRDWDEQLRTALEFAAAWVPVTDETYQDARRQVEEAVAGRKNLREFGQWESARPGAPKSSLDGARTTVLIDRDQRSRHAGVVRKYRIAPNEQLDAIGLLKRCGGDPEQFTPIRTVALAKWLDVAAGRACRALKDVNQACDGIDGLHRLHCRRIRPNGFAYDADIFFRSRWDSLLRELITAPKERTEEVKQELEALREQWEPVQTAVKRVLEVMRDPDPYVCCLVADGDHMGMTLKDLDQQQHRDFSEALGTFPEAARQIVEEHAGSLVYSGGDDVLAFVPVTEAVQCADDLQREFLKIMGCRPVSLSVGLGIGHTLTGMGDLLDLARRAENLAKKERNSLAVIVQKRTGGEDFWTAGWATARTMLDAATERLGGLLPRGKVAEVRDRLRRCPDAKAQLDDQQGEWLVVLRSEVERIAFRAEGHADAPETPIDPAATNDAPADVRTATLARLGLTDLTAESYQTLHKSVDAWVKLHRVAMALAQAEAALGEK